MKQVLTAKDLGKIRAMLLTECAPLNAKVRKELIRLKKENKELKERLNELSSKVTPPQIAQPETHSQQ